MSGERLLYPVGCAVCRAAPGSPCRTTRRALYGAGGLLSPSQMHKQRRLDIEAYRRAVIYALRERGQA